MQRMNHLIMESAREWGISARTAMGLCVIPILGSVVLVAARLSKDLYRSLLGEDGPIEWAGTLCLLAACLAGLGVAGKRFRAGHRYQGLLYGGFALLMFLAAGEEISWGQRVLGLKTPAVLHAINKQGEMTLHNIGGTLSVINLAMMLAGALGCVAFLLNRRIRLESRWDQADYLFVPPVFLAPSFFVVFLYRFLRWTVWPQSGFTVTRYAEWPELLFAMALGVFSCLNYRRLWMAERTGLKDANRPEGTTVRLVEGGGETAHDSHWAVADEESRKVL